MVKQLAALVVVVVLTAACSSSQKAVRPSPIPASTPLPTASLGSPPATPTPSITPLPSQIAAPTNDELLSIRMTSLTVMWAGTSQRVLRSTDAGRSWADVTPASGLPRYWAAFFALDDQAAWVAYSLFGSRTYRILRTFDGGRTWSAASGTLPGGSTTGLFFVDRLHGWATVGLGAAAGSEGVAVLSSGDGGASWTQIAQTNDPSTTQASSSGLSFNCDKHVVVFSSPSIGLLSRDCAGGPLQIYRTRDGGAHWVLVALPYPGPTSAQSYNLDPIFLTAADAVMEAFYYYGQNAPTAALLVTHDSGVTWKVYSVPGQGFIDFESTVSGWQLDSPTQATTNEGLSWHVLAVPAPPFTPSDMQLQDLGKGIAMAWSRLAAYRTDDGAHTWRGVAPSGLHE